MRRFDKKQNMKMANMLCEERHALHKMTHSTTMTIDEGITMDKIKDFLSTPISKMLPKVKDASDSTLEKVKEVIAKSQDFAVEEWNDPENKRKLESLAEKIKSILSKIKSAGVKFFSDPEKIKGLINTLQLGKYAALVKGIWDLVFASGATFGWSGMLPTASYTIGGVFFLKLALFIFVLQIVLKILNGALSLGSILGGMKAFVKSIIDLFISKDDETKPEPKSIEESMHRLFETYGYDSVI